tara:strand:- start:456 stop:1436 length:981 start_codon:yes stop_codon:yes gene_type:complete
MFDLKKIYNQLPLPESRNLNSYSAKAIKGFKNHRIAKNQADNPSLLIFISEQNQDFFIANQNLFSIKVSHNLRCEIESGDIKTHNNFSVVSYIGQNNDVKELFLSTCQILLKSLGQNPSNKQIKNTVEKFIELFKAVKENPRNSILGLWGELFLIEQSSFPEKSIAGWHSIPEEKFDFNFGRLRLEVKSSSTETRTHHFSSEQLNPVNDTEIIIASILTSMNSGGLCIADLLNKINNKLSNYPKQMEKLHLISYSTLGTNINNINQIKFDYELGIESLRFYKSIDVPKIENNNIPLELSNVKFVSNLTNVNSIKINIDKITKSSML